MSYTFHLGGNQQQRMFYKIFLFT